MACYLYAKAGVNLDEQRRAKGRRIYKDGFVTPACRLCDTELVQSVLDLGLTPLANSFVLAKDLENPEVFFPLHVRVCERCWLVQVPELENPQNIFRNYAYFSSYSESWVSHAKRYVDAMISRFGLGKESFVIELASNDGYLLKHFKDRGIESLGVEPAHNVATAAREAGITTVEEFFTESLGRSFASLGKRADLVVANNVLAQVPDLRDFTRGIAAILKRDGVVTVEFPHLLKTLERGEFDTVYHEHFSYFSFHAAETAFAAAGIRLFDVEELPTHGGSLRIFGCLASCKKHAMLPSVAALKETERSYGLLGVDAYRGFRERAENAKRSLLEFLLRVKSEGKTVAGYGAPAKGNTLLNFCGIKRDLLPYTVDKNPHKQGCYTPGSRIPVFETKKLAETKPDFVLILPWNLADEIMEQCAYIRQWGGKFVLPIPEVTVL